MKGKLLFFVFAIGVLALNSCYYDNEAYLYPNTFCDTTTVTYTSTIAPILQGNCAIPGCHVPGGTGTGDFTQVSVVAEKANSGILMGVLNAGSMPPTGYTPLRKCQVDQIGIWVANGALNN